jgi:hypothetical protein
MRGDEALVYDCAGLIVRSTVPLDQAEHVDPSTPVDVDFELAGEEDIPFARPVGDLLAECAGEDWVAYSFSRVDDHYLGRLYGVGDFEISGALDRITCRPAVGGRSEVIPIVVAGTLSAFIMAMRGTCVLHASAVEIGGQAVAFVGESGQGKTTMAAVLCAAGAALVTDDVLPLTFAKADDGRPIVHCRRSARELRIRQKASSLVELFGEEVGRRVTVDERHALAPAGTGNGPVPLTTVILPRPDREHPEVRSRRLGPGEAGMWLGRCQRIEGWCDPAQLRRQFHDIATVVETVRVYEVFVPWGPPFAPDLAERVLAACDVTDEGVDGPTTQADDEALPVSGA